MRCHVCGAELEPLVTDLPFKVSESTIVIVRGLPVKQCSNCQEFLIEDVVMGNVEEILSSVGAAAEIEVVRFAA